ncbi:hypothetical protein M427DRAFT_144552 [Gonapodya prolifera JEL478]|uniref:Cyclin N-terminal domain-containing protein n=1 Tax=Gonapodya prolifera (strain JEL478) TaxID=1344416 RepID=A0A139AKI0_GONPJ|nr:hypothetical protein M427DRAFT_144552 [Gonapodya prolifera JEL478]|eukprot:KXS17013.1 hypothetical protein M427DRAFT_144552 [Gonapodya prolifera JEL478]
MRFLRTPDLQDRIPTIDGIAASSPTETPKSNDASLDEKRYPTPPKSITPQLKRDESCDSRDPRHPVSKSLGNLNLISGRPKRPSPDVISSLVAALFYRLWDPHYPALPSVRSSLNFRRYLTRLFASLTIPLPQILAALYYVRKVRQRFGVGLVGRTGFESRLVVVGLLLSTKMWGGDANDLDGSYTSSFWSLASSVPLLELNIMEREFLLGLDHSLLIPQNEWTTWVAEASAVMEERLWEDEDEYDARAAVRSTRELSAWWRLEIDGSV